jgi:NSS family neurotransmitter:Na+ symporter
MGLGNALRFPSLCFKYGGGAFILAYALILFTICLPLLCVELNLRLDGNFIKGVNLSACLNSFFVAVYYSAIIVWLFQMAINIPQCILSGCNLSTFFLNNILPSDGGGVEFSPQTIILLLLCWVFICILLCGARSVERCARFVICLQVSLFLILALRGLAYSNSGTALYNLFVPKISTLSDVNLWAEALFQALLSLSLAAGVMPAFGKGMQKGTNTFLVGLVIICANFLGCLLSATAMFTSLFGCGLQGSMLSGWLFAFCVYPVAIARLFSSKILCGIFGVIFYSTLMLTAVQSALSLLSASITFKPKNLSKSCFAKILCGAGFLISCIFSTKYAYPVLIISDSFACNYSYPLIAACECFALIKKDHAKINKNNKFIRAQIKLSCMLFSLLTAKNFYAFVVSFKCRAFPQFELWQEVAFGWIEFIIVISLIIFYTLHLKFFKGNKLLWKRLKLSTKT